MDKLPINWCRIFSINSISYYNVFLQGLAGPNICSLFFEKKRKPPNYLQGCHQLTAGWHRITWVFWNVYGSGVAFFFGGGVVLKSYPTFWGFFSDYLGVVKFSLRFFRPVLSPAFGGFFYLTHGGFGHNPCSLTKGPPVLSREARPSKREMTNQQARKEGVI